MPAPDQAARASVGPATGQGSLRAFVLRFALAFVLLEAFVYLVLWHPFWFTPYAELNARLTAVLFSPFLEGLNARGAHLASPGFSMLVRPGCDGFQASAVLLAGVWAFPAPRSRKWIGAVGGVAAMLALNLLRLGGLLWTGIHHRAQFELMHIQILPGLFVGAALFLLLGWALWARS